jgi:hypothetical protein
MGRPRARGLGGRARSHPSSPVPELGHAAETKNVDGDDLLTALLARPDRRCRQARNREIRPGKRRQSHDNPGFERRRLPSTSWIEAVGKEGTAGQGGYCDLGIAAFPVGSQGGGGRNGGSRQRRKRSRQIAFLAHHLPPGIPQLATRASAPVTRTVWCCTTGPRASKLEDVLLRLRCTESMLLPVTVESC